MLLLNQSKKKVYKLMLAWKKFNYVRFCKASKYVETPFSTKQLRNEGRSRKVCITEILRIIVNVFYYITDSKATRKCHHGMSETKITNYLTNNYYLILIYSVAIVELFKEP